MIDSITATKVFIPHEDFAWVTGEVVAENGNGVVQVRIIDQDLPKENGIKPMNLNKLFSNATESLPLQNTDIKPDGVDDMCSLSYLHEPSILDNLRRFSSYSLLINSLLNHLSQEIFQ
jgi:myosin heavy subunit